MCTDLQIPVIAVDSIRVAVQGIRGCFSHQALMELFPRADAIFCEHATGTRDALRQGRLDGVLLPVENSLAGPVIEHQELVRQMCAEDGARVIAEHTMTIRQQFIGLPGAKIENLRQVYSHPVALAQCLRFFAEHPWLQAVPFFDTAGSVARIITEANTTQAAIAGALAAEIYNGEILLPDIQDSPDNSTRFVLLWAPNRELPAL
jgi:prephenate dehydratase